MKWRERKVIYIALLISLILHLIGLIIFTGFNLFAFSETKKPEVEEPLELVFEQPLIPDVERQEEIPEKFYEIVENPNATGESPETSDMLSTASSLSRAPVIIPGQIRAVPGTDEIEGSKQRESETEPTDDSHTNQEMETELSKTLLAYRENRSFSRSALTGKAEANENKKEEAEEGNLGETPNRPEGFDADLVGDFALSTYEWEWSSYMLPFKRKLNRLWYAPPAFYLGLIHGYTILRFKITRDGRMYDLEVLRHVGHSSLEKSSVNAIEAVFPFKSLPANFPDEYLELTIKLIYPNLKEYNMSRGN